MSRKLLALSAQLKLTAQLLDEKQIPSDLYAAPFNQIRNTIRLQNLSGAWPGNVSGEALLALRWAAWILPVEEESINAQDLQALRDQIKELEELLTSAEMPQALRQFLSTHLSQLKEALGEYDVLGVKPMRDAYMNIFVDAEQRKQQLTPIVQELPEESKGILHRFAKVAKNYQETINGAATSVENHLKLIGYGSAAYLLLEKALGQ